MSDDDHKEVDIATEGLLDGLDGAPRAARARLLRRLLDAGVELAVLKQAVEHDRLVLLPAERALGGEARYSAAELAAEVGVPVDYFLSVRRAHGLAASDPDERLYSEGDVEAARALAAVYEAGFDREAVLEAARVLGRGMAQLADALARVIGQTFLEAGVTEEDLAVQNAQAASEMLPRIAPVFEYVLRHHMLERLRHQAVTQATIETGRVPGARDMAVVFADLVAFTDLGERVGPEEVGDVASRLEHMAAECASPPVRLVKMIGDAAMLVAPDPAALVRGTLDLVAQADRLEGFPRLRAGATFGPALGRSGDWYGRTVNIASRITGVAEPGTVVATGELVEAAGEGFRWQSVGRRSLKGIEEPVELFRAYV